MGFVLVVLCRFFYGMRIFGTVSDGERGGIGVVLRVLTVQICGVADEFVLVFLREVIVVGEFMLGRASCRKTKTVGSVPSRVGNENFGGILITSSPSLMGFKIAGGIASILRGTNVRCALCSSVGPGPAVRGIRRNIRIFGRDNTSYVITVNNNSSVSATGTINVVVGGPRFTSIHSLRKITPAGGGTIPVVTIPAATNATTRMAVGCMVASIRGGEGVIYISIRSVPMITIISPSVVSAVPGKLATTANVSTLARTVRNCVAGNT